MDVSQHNTPSLCWRHSHHSVGSELWVTHYSQPSFLLHLIQIKKPVVDKKTVQLHVIKLEENCMYQKFANLFFKLQEITVTNHVVT